MSRLCNWHKSSDISTIIRKASSVPVMRRNFFSNPGSFWCMLYGSTVSLCTILASLWIHVLLICQAMLLFATLSFAHNSRMNVRYMNKKILISCIRCCVSKPFLQETTSFLFLLLKLGISTRNYSIQHEHGRFVEQCKKNANISCWNKFAVDIADFVEVFICKII